MGGGGGLGATGAAAAATATEVAAAAAAATSPPPPRSPSSVRRASGLSRAESTLPGSSIRETRLSKRLCLLGTSGSINSYCNGQLMGHIISIIYYLVRWINPTIL
ncbi:uncharacterized protein LAJ45_06681 [Morchella importuna]|uniref:uncharacterized protein n=1 Tax=Morchella importuna TaxID=1174673 RepID=UPI001E8EB830|nr:uncharacterized protein LAJ45_06681 [Morchella importuna]KAH8149142.1 hypothetical protein LAJ45_06681 [Morchella importuna]